MNATPAETTGPVLHTLSGLRFSKGHGTGNDFVLVADPEGTRSFDEHQAAALCDRLKADGGTCILGR